MVKSGKKSPKNQTPGKGLFCIFLKWPPLKHLMYYWLFMVNFTPYKCISNRQENDISELSIFSSASDELWRNFDVYFDVYFHRFQVLFHHFHVLFLNFSVLM